ncbi:MAG: VCBS repeat-containing protein, partial [Alphaproteobacteria bacterium]|nr:VCBS repeat-containing protein [Alphaproteobacteria bacterium]
QAPNAITAYNNANHSLATISRPICKYPDTLSYTGSGSIFDAANFTCVTHTTDPLASSWQMANDIGTNGEATDGRMTYGIADTHDLAAVDRSSSIVFRDNQGDVRVWLMNGTELSKPGNPSTIVQDTIVGNVPKSWSLVGQDDFVGHGFASLLWRDRKGGAAVWGMNGANVESVTDLSPLQSNRSVVATGSFTNNNTMQHVGGILWQDNDRNLYVSVMNNGQIASTSPAGALPADWTVVGADLNGWIFLRNTVTGGVRVWVLQVGSAQCAAASPTFATGGTGSECGPDPTIAITADIGSMPHNWSIAGIGDFDRDGYSDILWRDHLGNVRIWLLGTTPNSLNIRSSADLGNVPLNWSIVQTGDYNGDGFSDILWEDDTGNLKAWFMQGTTVAKTQILGKIGLKWTVQSLNDQ